MEITFNDISGLQASQLQELLNKLMCAECCECGISIADIRETLPERITIKDGGADGLLYTDNTNNSQFFFCNKIIFQAKATKITSLKSEIQKEHVKNFIRNGGGYVLFCNKYNFEGINALKKELKFKQEIACVLGMDVQKINFKLFDHSKIKEWIEHHPAVKIWFLEQIGKGCGIFQSFDRWSENEHMMSPLKTNDILEKELNDVGNCVQKEKILRIEGQSGIGKTRRIFEIIKRDELLQHNVLYIDNTENIEQKIIIEINKWINLKHNVIIILDDCPLEFHDQVKEKILNCRNNIRLISIDYVSSDKKSPYERGKYISLSMVGEDIIKEILREYYPIMANEDLVKLAHICSYNPRMAEILGSFSKTNQGVDFSSCIPEYIINRMVTRHIWDKECSETTKLLEVFSLFDRIEYEGKNDFELLELAKLAKIDTTKILKHFCILSNQLKVIQSRYGYHFVVPKVLAFQMALNWCKTITASVRSKLLNELPSNMKQALLRQLANINDHQEIQDIAEELSEMFSQEEVLNTSFGSECFYQLSIINPQASLKLLQKTFYGYTKQDYLAIKEGRRNIVRALLVMAFHNNLFIDAARILLDLADAENESWGNNATGEFCDFFKLYLGGTQLAAIERLEIIKQTMKQSNIHKKEICIRALDNALQISHFSRLGGVEQQGAVTLEDWKPSSYDDMYEYISEIFDIFESELSDATSPFVQRIKEVIGTNIRHLIIHGFFHVIEQPLFRMFSSNKDGWELARISFNHLREFEIKKDKIDPSIVSQIMELEQILEATNLVEEIKFKLLTVNSWDMYGEEDDKLEDKISYYAKELSQQYNVLKSLLQDLNDSDNMNVFLFGKTLVSTLNIDQLNEIINTSAEQLKFKKVNSSIDASFLSGIFSGLDEHRDTNTIYSFFGEWIKNEKLIPWIIIISRSIKRSSELYQYWIRIIDRHNLDDLIYRCILFPEKESYEGEFHDISLLLKSLIKKSTQGAIRATIQGLYYILLRNKKIPKELFSEAQTIVNDIGILSRMGKECNNIHEYECTELWEYVYKTESKKIKSQYIQPLFGAIIERNYRNTFVHKYAIGIIKKHLESGDIILLEELGHYLIKDNDVLVWFEIYFSNYSEGKKISWVNSYNTDLIKKFISKNEICTKFIARSIALFDENDKMHGYFKYILENFANNSGILDELYSNIFNFSWMGEISGYYLMVLEIIKPLKDHPNKYIKRWAENLIDDLEKRIESSNKREELMKMGIY